MNEAQIQAQQAARARQIQQQQTTNAVITNQILAQQQAKMNTISTRAAASVADHQEQRLNQNPVKKTVITNAVRRFRV